MGGWAGVVLVGLAALLVLGLLLAEVIAWFGYRRDGRDVDHRALGLGFISAGLIATVALLVTDGLWIVGLAMMGARAIHHVRARTDPHREGCGRRRPSGAGS